MCKYTQDNNKSMTWPSIGYNLLPTSTKKPPSPVHKYVNLNSHSNTIYTTKYKIVGLEGLKDTLYRCTEVNNDLNTQLSIIICDVLTSNFACNVLKYFKDGGPMPTGQSQNAQPATDSDI